MPLLLGMRLIARRPRRALLSTASVAVTASGIVAVLAFHTTVHLNAATLSNGLGNPMIDRDEQMLTVLTVVLVALAILNAICAAWTTVLDARHSSALARALGATPEQVTAGIAAAQVLPAAPGVLLGIPLGIGLYACRGRRDRNHRPARLVAGRRGTRHPRRRRRAGRDPGPCRRAQAGVPDPAIRNGVMSWASCHS